MEAAYREMSQADFAREMNVSRAAVSQWKSNGILKEDAFTKPGKTGKLRYEIAVDQVRRNRDIGQSLGNGIATRTSGQAAPVTPAPVSAGHRGDVPEPAASQPTEATPPKKQDTIEDQLKRAKLEEQLRRNRTQAADEALQHGRLMSASDVREQMARVASLMMQVFEGALPDFAAALAEKFDIPQRDALHLLRAEFNKARATAARKARSQTDADQKTVTAQIDVDE